MSDDLSDYNTIYLHIGKETKDPDKPPFLTQKTVPISPESFENEKELVIQLYRDQGEGEFSIQWTAEGKDQFSVAWKGKIKKVKEDGKVRYKVFQRGLEEIIPREEPRENEEVLRIEI